ncbi:hypothetical protein LUZ63_015102 [Rhynchospora breviuscula]|uniref:Uncharacterized protein n=1 Tax=Rhynchospora breviuscula TaxID=2022672 RepID=A0A9Q0CBP8_9POAL|nr:hypothetical protein LUZ63_015102 [Rhynchospora breviuscula]
MSQTPDSECPLLPESAPEEPSESAPEEPSVDPEPLPVPVPVPDTLPTPMDIAVPENPSECSNPTRKPANKRKKSKSLSKKYLAMREQKLSLLKENLNPMPFCPPSSLPDLSKHEALFRALGLWDFAHLNLDQDLRPDLIASLITFYDPSGRKSLVNGVKISVSRADLARALSLPAKKKPSEEPESDLFRSDEAGSILSNFISSYMLFHLQEDDDACILPDEVAEATGLVRSGRPDKVYWADLIWGFVEKELKEVPKTGTCYYASYLQQLIKYQQPRLLEEVPTEEKVVPEVPEVEASADVTMEEAEDEEEEEDEYDDEDEEDGIEKTKSLEELADVGTDEVGEPRPGPGLSLGLSGEENSGFEGGPLSWGAMQERGEESFGHSLQPCRSSGFGFESLSKPVMDGTTEINEEGEQYMRSFQRMDSSTDLLQAMENVSNVNLYNTGSDLNNQDMNSGDFLSMSGDPTNNGSFYFTDAGKRPLTEIDEDREEDDEDEEEEDDGIHMQASKRMRSETGNWTYGQPSALEESIERFRAIYNERDQAAINAQMQVQYLTNMIQEKDQVIHQLERSRYENQQKYTAELSRYEQEMNIMAQLVSGYKRALKQNRHAFSEYRKKYPEGKEREKLRYGDVPNGGGLVICTKELERQKLEREIEMKQVALGLISQFQREWVEKFEGFGARVSHLERKAGGLGDRIEGCKKNDECKVSLSSAEGTEL